MATVGCIDSGRTYPYVELLTYGSEQGGGRGWERSVSSVSGQSHTHTVCTHTRTYASHNKQADPLLGRKLMTWPQQPRLVELAER